MKFVQEFDPTPAMQLYAYQRAKLGDSATEVSIAKQIGINPATISNWKQLRGFLEWVESQCAVYRSPILEMLEQVALERLAAGDFRYWEAMAKKYGFITKDGETQPGSVSGIRMTPDELVLLVKKVREQAHVTAAVAATTTGAGPSGQV